MSRPIVLPALLLILAILGAASRAEADRLKVCAFSFHTPDEVAVFKSRLPAQDFEVIDLSPELLQDEPQDVSRQPSLLMESNPGRRLTGLCRNDLKCDVVVYSAEFAGRFFGRYGQSLGLQEMEEASCQARCAGLFHTPREVFLLACNTLATKDDDMRTPEVYLQVLLGHGFDRASAERVVAMRYGPLGPTFREAFRRVFMGVPRIYGFSSVAPTGEYTAPMLERYFRSVGDYRRHLDQAGRDDATNDALKQAFAGTSLVQVPGLTPGEPSSGDRDLICELYDERVPVVRRLEIARQLMERPEFLAFVPTVQVFIDRHPSERMQGEERRIFDEIARNRTARDRVVELAEQLDVSALRLELAHFAVHMGWMSRDELRRISIDSARKLLHQPLSTEVVDVMCELPKHESVGDQFRTEDLPDLLFHDPEGIRLVSCLAPTDKRVDARLGAELDATDPPLRAWAAHALSRRLPLPEPVLLTAAQHLNDPSPEVSERLRWIFRAQWPLPDDVRRAIQAHDPKLAAELAAPRPKR